MVDADEDLVALCSRMQANEAKHLAILFCEEAASDEPPASRRSTSPPPRAYH